MDSVNGFVSSLRSGSVTVLTVTNSTIDLRNAKAFQRELVERIGEEKQIVLDMKAVDFVDSAGLGGLISVLRNQLTRSGDVRLAGLSDRVAVLLEVTRLDRVFTIFPDVDHAVASYATA